MPIHFLSMTVETKGCCQDYTRGLIVFASKSESIYLTAVDNPHTEGLVMSPPPPQGSQSSLRITEFMASDQPLYCLSTWSLHC